ncbi:MAG: hypothetical protein SCARUB_04177 [Candidatus Scalindua rubra]|uniref:Uncharacterized protein n=1 Tax=Candidatus Scalindua rubra TaxID=1872076 RepID=A0A1E3X4V7_9BACT|nr:MAG: hypothetical protein SCARUB_04177 [Candidatus Scalindua rubra]
MLFIRNYSLPESSRKARLPSVGQGGYNPAFGGNPELHSILQTSTTNPQIFPLFNTKIDSRSRSGMTICSVLYYFHNSIPIYMRTCLSVIPEEYLLGKQTGNLILTFVRTCFHPSWCPERAWRFITRDSMHFKVQSHFAQQNAIN